MLKKAHLLRWRPRPPCHVTCETIGLTNFRLRGPDMAPHSPYATTPRVRPAGAASQLDLFEVRREGVVFLPVQVRLGELSVRPSSYRDGEEGNRLAEALGTGAHHGWVGKSTGRNVREARAGLERKS